VALDTLGFQLVRDVAPGEAILHRRGRSLLLASNARRTRRSNPCIFEFVYLARPDSVIDGISVYETRLRMGESLADKISASIAPRHRRRDPDPGFEPAVGDAALEAARTCRTAKASSRTATSAAPSSCRGRRSAAKSVRQKLNAIGMEFKGKNVLLVDDSIVRGTTSREIVQMAREAGARKVFFASAAPPVRFPNVYGIDMPTRDELIATAAPMRRSRARSAPTS
jgi:amidophosphoribosyltransferase